MPQKWAQYIGDSIDDDSKHKVAHDYSEIMMWGFWFQSHDATAFLLVSTGIIIWIYEIHSILEITMKNTAGSVDLV